MREIEIRTAQYLKQAGGVADVVPNHSLSRDPDFILVYGRLRPRLLHSLVPIHRSHRTEADASALDSQSPQREGGERESERAGATPKTLAPSMAGGIAE